MLLLALDYLRSLGFKIPSAFAYSSTRMLLASTLALLLTIWLGPLVIRKLYAWKIGQPIRSKEECPLLAELHHKKKDTPTMGGALLLFVLLFNLVLFMDWKSSFTLILGVTTVVLGLLGAFDDYQKLRYKNSKGVPPRVKFGVQFLLSACIASYMLSPALQSGIAVSSFFHPPVIKEAVSPHTMEVVSNEAAASRIYLPFKKDPLVILDGWLTPLCFLWFMLVITGASNAVNLTDGLDGLAAGCLILVSAVLALFAFLSNHVDMARYLRILYIEGSSEIAIYLLALSGASLGFLWYNGYPAQVFMGDTGSLPLGGILGVAAVLLRRELILSLAGAIFVAEALSVILQVASFRYRNKKRIFLCAPLHHHFEYKGWPETKVVIRFWILTLLFAIISIMSLKLQ